MAEALGCSTSTFYVQLELSNTKGAFICGPGRWSGHLCAHPL